MYWSNGTSEGGQRYPPLQEGAAHYRALEPDGGERLEVVHRANSACREHGQARSLAHTGEQGEIGPGQGAVALDGRAVEPCNACFRAPGGRLVGCQASVLGPPGDRDSPCTHVECDHEPLPE